MSRPPFTDSHVHFYDMRHPTLRYTWLDPLLGPDSHLGDYSAIKAQRYWPDDFSAETRFQNVGNIVHVQAAFGTDDPVQETGWLQGLSDRIGVPHAAIAYCDLAAPDAEDVLSRHRESSIVCGIRDAPQDGYLTAPAWRRGYSLLERHSLVYCDQPRLENMLLARDLAREFPGVTLCIDHMGSPRQRDRESFKPWFEGMSALASAPNTVIKISGLGLGDHEWTVDSSRDWILACIDLWGVHRSFFGTNWPIDRLFSSYGDVLDAYWETITNFSADEKHALFHGTADRLFGLEPQVPAPHATP